MFWVIVFLGATAGFGFLGFGVPSPVAHIFGQLLFGLSLIALLVALMVWALQKGGPARTSF
ncbi:MAG TPA: hypothetical protein VFZ03_01910 [Dongiaceae bacterium]